MDKKSSQHFLLAIYRSAIDAVNPEKCLYKFLPPKPPRGRTLVIGAGKAAASMAQTIESFWQDNISGLVVTRYA